MADAMPRLVEQLLTRADAVLGAYSAILFGSLVRGDYRENRSDVNLLIVSDGLTPSHLRDLSAELAAFETARLPPPMLFSRAEWSRAADVFPIEITDMRQAYRVVRGNDPLAGVTVDPADLRRALEAELRGKLLRLRSSYALYSGKPEQLAAVVGHSVGSIRVLLRAALALTDEPVPADDAALAEVAARRIGVPAATLGPLLGHRRDLAWSCPAELFESYLAAVDQAVHYVDTVQPGVH
jgi:predicted nucleotidyltransferase